MAERYAARAAFVALPPDPDRVAPHARAADSIHPLDLSRDCGDVLAADAVWV